MDELWHAGSQQVEGRVESIELLLLLFLCHYICISLSITVFHEKGGGLSNNLANITEYTSTLAEHY